ncbi:NAD(P)/FAD-dependent oxidoreductase [Sulfitobacter aestuariivivens]|uniref:NAD(P)/FAD-dependent oxidoreductase n=1 Tax=Sulfitobacter aestuariivivens TaxID=2766981 RepID=UPI003620B24E
MRFPISLDTPVTFPGPPPARADVIVIGGGVIGVCTALYLARAGHEVLLLEKGRIAGEQSSRNWGWIRQQGRDPDELPIMVEAIGLWKSLAAQTNIDIGLRQEGISYLASDAQQLARFEAWLTHAHAHNVDTKVVSPAETRKMFPNLAGDYAGAMITSSDMRAEPWVAVPAIAGIAVRESVQIVENCAVRSLDLEAGRVVGVVTEAGRIAASSVVLAGGAWSSLFLRNHGVSIPQLSVRENVAATEPLADICAGATAGRDVALRRRLDGGYTLAPPDLTELYVGPDAFRALPKFLPRLRHSPFGQMIYPAAPPGFPDAWGTARSWEPDQETPFERMRVLDPTPNRRRIEKLRRDFEEMFPALGPVRLKAAWAGMIDTMPDIVPIVDQCASLPGLVIGTGMSGHGFGIGPAMGKILAALVTGDAVGHDLGRFRLSRFTDGSAMRLGPSL